MNSLTKEKRFETPNLSGKIIEIFIKKQNALLEVTMKASYKTRLKYLFIIALFIISLILLLINNTNNLFCYSSIAALTILIYVLSGAIIEEKIINIECLGIQLVTKYVFGQKSTFIPFEKIQDVFINEVITKQKIIHILTVKAKDSASKEVLIPLFTGSEPRLMCLEIIYKILNEVD